MSARSRSAGFLILGAALRTRSRTAVVVTCVLTAWWILTQVIAPRGIFGPLPMPNTACLRVFGATAVGALASILGAAHSTGRTL